MLHGLDLDTKSDGPVVCSYIFSRRGPPGSRPANIKPLLPCLTQLKSFTTPFFSVEDSCISFNFTSMEKPVDAQRDRLDSEAEDSTSSHKPEQHVDGTVAEDEHIHAKTILLLIVSLIDD